MICGPEREVEQEREVILRLFPGKKIEPQVRGAVEERTLLGVKVRYNRCTRGLSLSQSEYAAKVASKFCGGASDGAVTRKKRALANEGDVVPKEHFDYRGCVGALNYLVAMTRPDIAWSVSQLSRYLDAPKESAVQEAQRIAKYVGDTRDLGLVYRADHALGPGRENSGDLTGFCDADYAGCPNTRKSTTGCIVYL